MSRTAKWIVGLLAAFVISNVVVGLAAGRREGDHVRLSAALDAIDARQVRSAEISGQRVMLTTVDGRKLRTGYPDTYGDDLIALLHRQRITFTYEPRSYWPALVVLAFAAALAALVRRWLRERSSSQS